MELNTRRSLRRWSIPFVVMCVAGVLAAGTAQATPFATARPAANIKPMTLRVAYFLGENTSIGQAMKWWMDSVTRETGGAVKFDVFWGGTLVGPTDMVNALRNGQIQIGLVSPAYYPGQFPLSMISNVPFYQTNTPAESAAMWQLVNRPKNPLSKEWAKNGLHPIAFTTVEPSVLGTKKPINSLSDLSGVPIRGVDQPSGDALRAAGANAVTMPIGQVYQAIQTNVLGGYYGVPFDFVAPLHLNEVASYVTDPGLGLYALDALAMSQSTWNSLQPAVQKIMLAVGNAFPAQAARTFAQAGDAACTALKKAGTHIAVLPKAVHRDWQNRIGTSLFNDWKKSSSNSGAFLASLQTALHAQLHKYNSWKTSISRCVQAG